MTIYHFGEGDEQSNPWSLGWQEIVARGGTFLVTIYAHEAEVAGIFTHIVAGKSVDAVANVMRACTVMQLVYVVCIVNMVVKLLFSLQLPSARKLLLEILTLNLMYYFASPLMAFTVYFNLYHSQRHVERVSQMSTWTVKLQLMRRVEVVFTCLATAALIAWICTTRLSTLTVIFDARPLLRPTFVVISVL